MHMKHMSVAKNKNAGKGITTLGQYEKRNKKHC